MHQLKKYLAQLYKRTRGATEESQQSELKLSKKKKSEQERDFLSPFSQQQYQNLNPSIQSPADKLNRNNRLNQNEKQKLKNQSK